MGNLPEGTVSVANPLSLPGRQEATLLQTRQPPPSSLSPADSQLYDRVDTDRNGQLSLEEVLAAIDMLGLNVSSDYVKGAWRTYDVDGNGQLSRPEFANFMKVLRTRVEQTAMSDTLADLVQCGDLPGVQRAIAGGADPNAGVPPLWWAARTGHTEIVRALCDAGANVEWANPSSSNGIANDTSLIRACVNGNEPAAAVLLEHKAQIDAVDQNGMTALMWAARYSHAETAAALLLRFGTDTALRATSGEFRGKTALEIAEANYVWTTAALLRDPRNPPYENPRACGLLDCPLAPGTRLRVEAHGEGTYERFEKKTFGANLHFVRVNDGEEVLPIKLKNLQPTQWSVLPPLTVELNVVSMTGSAFVLADVSLGWTVLQLKRAICADALPDAPPLWAPTLWAPISSTTSDLMRLVVKDTPLDDETALLSVCGVSAEVGVNVVSQTVEDAAKRRTEGEMRAGVAVRTARPVVKTVSQTRVPVVVCGCVPSADIAAVTNIGENLLNPGQVSVCTALLTLLLYLASGLAAMVVAFSMSSFVGLFGMDLSGSALGWITFLFNLFLLPCSCGLGQYICDPNCGNGKEDPPCCKFFIPGQLIMLFSIVMCWVITYDVNEYHSLSGASIGTLSPVHASDAVNRNADFDDVTFQPQSYIDISLGVAVVDVVHGTSVWESLGFDPPPSGATPVVKYCMAPVVSGCGAESQPSWETCNDTISHCLGLGQPPPQCRAQSFPGLDIRRGNGTGGVLQGCVDTDWPAKDACRRWEDDGDGGSYCAAGYYGCEWYDRNAQQCSGEFDDYDFVASRMCCACGGGGVADRNMVMALTPFWVAINLENSDGHSNPSSADLEQWNLGSSNLDICRTAWLQYVVTLNAEVQDQNDRLFPLAKNDMAPLTSEIFTAANQHLISAYPDLKFGSFGTASGDVEIQELLAAAFSKGPVKLPTSMSPTFMMFQP
jgi:hypothetical protein